MDTSISEALLDVIDEVARAELGPLDATGAELAERVAELSELYTRDRSELAARSSHPSLIAARLRFFLPRDLPKFFAPIAELRGTLPEARPWRVLDLGAGLGASALGVAAAARRLDPNARLEVTAVDRFERGLSLFAALAERSERAGLAPISLRTYVADMRRARPRGPFDLIVVGFALNEVEARSEAAAAWLEGLGTLLTEQGALVVLEPALRPQSRFLQEVRDLLCAPGSRLHVVAPCLHDAPCPLLVSERDWCHQERLERLPDPLIPTARQAGLRFERLTYSYMTLRRARGALCASSPGKVSLRVVSQPKISKGKREVVLCGAGGRVVAQRLDRHHSAANAAFAAAERGVIVSFADPPPAGGRLRVGEDTEVIVRDPSLLE